MKENLGVYKMNNSKIKRKFIKLQYKEDVYNMCEMLIKYEWLNFYLIKQYDYNWLILQHKNSSDDDW